MDFQQENVRGQKEGSYSSDLECFQRSTCSVIGLYTVTLMESWWDHFKADSSGKKLGHLIRASGGDSGIWTRTLPSLLHYPSATDVIIALRPPSPTKTHYAQGSNGTYYAQGASMTYYVEDPKQQEVEAGELEVQSHPCHLQVQVQPRTQNTWVWSHIPGIKTSIGYTLCLIGHL